MIPQPVGCGRVWQDADSSGFAMWEFGSQLFLLAMSLVVIAGLCHVALTPRYRFVITINDGNLRVTKGVVSAEFLHEIRDVCQEYHIASGWIGGVGRGKSIALRFSGSIPRGCQQRLRNIWFAGKA